MIYHFVKKGRLPSEIYNLPAGEKLFLYSSMLCELDEKELPFKGVK